MTWNELTVWQYQQIYPIVTKPEKDWTTLDVESKLVGILHNLTDTQVDSLSVAEFNKLKANLGFLNDKIEGNSVKYTEVNGKRYKFIYDVQQIKAARYIETKVFSTDLVGNLHKLAASMVMPQRKNWWGKWVDDTYDAAKHSEYAEDLQGAKFMHVYQSVVFFYQVYRNWIEVSQVYLVKQMMSQGMSMESALKVVQTLCEILDGNIAPNLLPTTKIYQLTKAMNLQQYNS
jgi:hypothetical protein